MPKIIHYTKHSRNFGRIIKSRFILTYFDDLELRQRIEKH
jgi:TnpA family transposase